MNDFLNNLTVTKQADEINQLRERLDDMTDEWSVEILDKCKWQIHGRWTPDRWRAESRYYKVQEKRGVAARLICRKVTAPEIEVESGWEY